MKGDRYNQSVQEDTNPKLTRYEQMIEQLRKLIDLEKKNCFQIKTLYSKEMETKKDLESILKRSIEDVREEISKKKNETQNIYKQIKRNQLKVLNSGNMALGE